MDSWIQNIKIRFKRTDIVIWIIYLFLILCSAIEVFSASSTLTRTTAYWQPLVKHLSFLFLGFLGICFLVVIPSKLMKNKGLIFVFLLISLFLLVLTQVGGIGTEANEASRWITLLPGVSVQPSEFVKFAVIFSVASLLSIHKETKESTKTIFWLIAGVVGISCGLIFMDNISTACILGTISFLMMFVAHFPVKYMWRTVLGLVVFAGSLFLLSYVVGDNIPLLKRIPTAVSRLTDYSEEITPETNKSVVFNDDHYQVSNAKIAISNGGILFGKGPGNSLTRDFLPQAYSDFIYAIILEEFGTLLAFFVLLLYFSLLYRAKILAKKVNKSFYAYLLIGIAMLFVFQAFINMSVAVNLFPVTGQPLPLISKGGTSGIISSLYIGVMLNISGRIKEIEEKKQKELETIALSLKEEEINEEENEEI